MSDRTAVGHRDALVRLFDHNGAFLTLLRDGLEGLTDAEYFWEPVENCWSVRPRSELRTPEDPELPDGDWAVEISYPDPKPSPFTTIAWRLAHMTGSMYVAAATVRGARRPDGAIDTAWQQRRTVASSAAEAVDQWNGALGQLRAQLAEATIDDTERMERVWWDPPDRRRPVWEHVLYFGYFEPASHSAEVRLLRDLYRHTAAATIALRRPDPMLGA